MYRMATAKRWVSLLWEDSMRHIPEVENLLSRVEQIPGTRRHPRAFDIPYTALSLPDVQALFDAAGVGRPAFEKATLPQPLHDLHRPSLEHQRDAALKLAAVGCGVVADDMGLGKCQTATLAAHYHWQEHGGSWLILAPLFTRATWISELLTCGVIQSEDEVCVLQGRKNNHHCWRDDAPVYFAHYDIIEAWFPRFGINPPRVVIADEVHNLRNARTKRGKGAALAMGPAKVRVLLTGTPMENRPSDLWHLLEMATGRGTWGSPSDFRRRYCGAVQGEWGLEDTGPTNVAELQQRMAPFYTRRTVDDVAHLALPELSRQPVLTELSGKRATLHKQGIEELDLQELFECVQAGRSFGEETLTVLHRLRALTSDAKVAETSLLAESLAEQGESAVVFTWRRETAELLCGSVRGAHNTFVVHGGVGTEERDMYIREFQKHGGLLFATYGALKEGVTLHKARHMILHDLDWGPSTIAQAEKRIHRIGQKRACTSHWMLCDKSIDTIFATILGLKMRDNAEVLGIDYGFNQMIELVAQHAPELPEMAQQALDAWRKW